MWPGVADFLGYAPVLSVLSEYLAVPNPSKEITQPLQAGLRASRILFEIIESILAREQRKFSSQVESKLRAILPVDENWPSPVKIYAPMEQNIRLVARMVGVGIVVSPPACLPNTLRVDYEYQAGQFIADHPFLAGSGAVNAIFSDYLLARAAIDRDCHAALKPNPAEHLSEVGPFFYQFVHEFAPRETGSDESEDIFCQIPDSLVPTVLDSYLQSRLNPDATLFVYYQSGAGGYLVLSEEGSWKKGERNLEFSVTDISGVTQFPHQLARGIVVTNGGVVLGTDGQRFLLGPRMTIRCAELEIRADRVSVQGRVSTQCRVA